MKQLHILIVFIIGTMTASSQVAKTDPLHQQLASLDKTYFDAYNACDLDTQASLLAEDIEFYHDSGGLETSKEKLITAIKNNVCGKVTRKLVEGSLETHRIPGYGAILMGMHSFHNSEEPDAISKPSKFVGIWKQEGDQWLMTRVISLHSS